MAVIDKRVKKDGTVHYRVRVRLKGQRPRFNTFERLTDAKKWAQSEEADIRRGLRFDNHAAETHTFAEAVRVYEEFPAHRMQQRQLEQRKRILKWWLERLGPCYLSDITPQRLNEYKHELMKKTKGDEPGAAVIAPATIHSYLVSMSAVLNFAKRELHWIRMNPMDEVVKPVIKNQLVRFLDKEEREDLLAQCLLKKRHPLLYPFVILALCTGMRKGELQNLRWKDVDFAMKVIRVQASKNGQKRSVPLTGPAWESLAKLSKVRRLDTDLVFARKDGLAAVDLKKHWESSVRDACVKQFRFHDLRHSAATYLLEAGASLPELTGILGHKTVQMVMRYAHLAENHAVAVAERMTSRVFG